VAAGARANYALFSRPTDTIFVAGDTNAVDQMTIEARIMIPASMAPAPFGRIFGEEAGSQEDKMLHAWSAGFDGGAWTGSSGGNDDGISTATPLSPDVWHHLAFVRDNHEQRLYLDGVRVQTRDLSGTPWDAPIRNASDDPMSIGAFSSFYFNESFRGAMEWVHVSDSVRYAGDNVPAAVAVPVADAHTQVLFDFTSVAPGTTVLTDQSSNHFTGTVATGFGGATAPTFVPEPTCAAAVAIGFICATRRRPAGTRR
jgi:hypothetical protein